MKVKIIPQVHFGQTFFYNDSKRTAEWLQNPEEKSYQDLVNDFLAQVKPIQVFVYEDSMNGSLVTTIVYEDGEK